MSTRKLYGFAVVTFVVATAASAAPARNLDECLRELRSGPTSFAGYLCLGTPGLPDRPNEVRAILEQVLKRNPGEPHARVYLGLMRVYLSETVDKREFTEPLAALERARLWPDVFLAQMALLEWTCIGGGSRVLTECRELGPLLARADQLARSIGDPGLVRLGTIARMRWSLEVLSYSEGRRAEREFEHMPGAPPEWLRVLEVSTRAQFAKMLGDDVGMRQLYLTLLNTAEPGSVAHGAALAGLAAATARMALGGLADRTDAERLLRMAIAEQEQTQMVRYNSAEIGTESSRLVLATLLGRTPETLRFFGEGDDHPLAVELLLQGDGRERARALQLAKKSSARHDPNFPFFPLSLAHAELVAGSPAQGMFWGDRAVDLLEESRGRESDDQIKMRGDASRAIVYQTYISDLLNTRREDPEFARKAWEVLERLRARVLLERLLAREKGTETEPMPAAPTIQAALREDEALVSYFVWQPRPNSWAPYTRGHSYALVLTRTSLRVVRIAQGETLEPAVKAWSRLVDERGAGTEPGSRRLYVELMKPALEVLPANVTSLVLVPDGPLHRVPFDALSETGGAPYLADRYNISVVPSASVWLQLRKRTPAPSGLAIAFANTPEGPAVPIAETRGEIVPGQLGPLIHAREEAEEAVNAFPRGSRLFVGADATSARLTPENLKRASLVHFAAHGVADAREPDESFLLLAPASGASGMLKVADVLRFDWTGKTVVLSACDTSVGAVRIGEGVLSLARGFFAGGASAVIGTLSRVRDDDQRALFHAFYAELRRGVSVSEAMGAAKRSLIRAGAPPAAWANVTVLGDGTVHPRAPDPLGRSRSLGAVAVLGAVLVIVVGWRARRRHSRS